MTIFHAYDRGGRFMGEIEASDLKAAENIALKNFTENVRVLQVPYVQSFAKALEKPDKVEERLMKFQVCNEYGQVVGDVQADAIHTACEIAAREFPTGSYLRFEEKGKEIQENIVRAKPSYIGPTVHEFAQNRLKEIRREIEDLEDERRLCYGLLKVPRYAHMLESERRATQAEPFQATQLPVG